jgi:hypothetical protein
MDETLFTPAFIETLWTAPQPKDLLAAAIKDHSGLFEEADTAECQLMSEMMLHVICDSIEEVKLSFLQTSEWIEAAYIILKDNVRNKSFTRESDFKQLSVVLAQCKILTKEHLAKLIATAKLTYFAHYNLFAEVFTCPREQAHIAFTYTQDLPDEGLPLASAALVEPPPPIQEDTSNQVTLSEFRAEMQDQYKYVGIDEATRASIMERLRKARLEMEAQLEQRQKQLGDKIAALEPKKRK